MELLEKFGLLLLGALIPGVGYLIKRWIEKKPQLDSLEKSQKLLAINKELAAQNITVEDLNDLEMSLLAKRRATESHETAKGFEADLGEFRSNADLKQDAAFRLKKAELKLEEMLFEFSRLLDEEELEILEKSQKKWKTYRDEQAALAASGWEGGTGYGLVYLTEQEVLTAARIAEIQSRLDFAKAGFRSSIQC